MEKLKTILIANLGTSTEPVIRAIETATTEESPIAIFLVYGREIGNQEKAPFSIMSIIEEKAKQSSIGCKVYELDAPEIFEKAFLCYKTVMDDVIKCEPNRVIVDVTGGTKVMAAALTHAVLTRDIGVEIVFEYVGGGRGANGRVNEMNEMVVMRDTGIITRERITTVIQSIRQQEFVRAAFFSRNLPKHGKALFLRQATEHFWRWDNFHYDDTAKYIDEIATQARVLIEDEQLGKIAETISRHKKHNANIKLAISLLRQAKDDNNLSLNKAVIDGWLAMCGDTIANAKRRLDSDPVDCVLRCYRAVETTAQLTLFNLGVNPWKPDWNKLGPEKCKELLSIIGSKELPKNITLYTGIKLIQILTSPFTPEFASDLGNIMGTRNNSYLEHGYDKVPNQAAKGLVEKTEQISSLLFPRTGLKGDILSIAHELRIEA
jgi:hypothetical protein